MPCPISLGSMGGFHTSLSTKIRLNVKIGMHGSREGYGTLGASNIPRGILLAKSRLNFVLRWTSGLLFQGEPARPALKNLADLVFYQEKAWLRHRLPHETIILPISYLFPT
jgi:hypothetical protein